MQGLRAYNSVMTLLEVPVRAFPAFFFRVSFGSVSQRKRGKRKEVESVALRSGQSDGASVAFPLC
jgi:hypothetical protein